MDTFCLALRNYTLQTPVPHLLSASLCTLWKRHAYALAMASKILVALCAVPRSSLGCRSHDKAIPCEVRTFTLCRHDKLLHSRWAEMRVFFIRGSCTSSARHHRMLGRQRPLISISQKRHVNGAYPQHVCMRMPQVALAIRGSVLCLRQHAHQPTHTPPYRSPHHTSIPPPPPTPQPIRWMGGAGK